MLSRCMFLAKKSCQSGGTVLLLLKLAQLPAYASPNLKSWHGPSCLQTLPLPWILAMAAQSGKYQQPPPECSILPQLWLWL